MNNKFYSKNINIMDIWSANSVNYNIYKDLYKELSERLISIYSNKGEIRFFTVPGRTEICGNHTDHNNGKVIAASVNVDLNAAVQKNNSTKINIHSELQNQSYSVEIDDTEIKKNEMGTTTSIIRGIVDSYKKNGFEVGGFDAYIRSNIPVGSGLSSSAAIEIIIGDILNHLFNDNSIDLVTIGKIGQLVENTYFGKPCGLMDQLACAIGGILTIDFEEKNNPKIKKIESSFTSMGYSIIIVKTPDDHANLTPDYAAITTEMKNISGYFGVNTLREISFDRLYREINLLRENFGDRAVLRAIHFLEENNRVTELISAFENGESQKILNLIKSSGNSSAKYLQNIYSANNLNSQGLNIALALSENFINKSGKGTVRVHGGGFAGTIQTIIPSDNFESYKEFMSPVFGAENIFQAEIRSFGSAELII